MLIYSLRIINRVIFIIQPFLNLIKLVASNNPLGTPVWLLADLPNKSITPRVTAPRIF